MNPVQKIGFTLLSDGPKIYPDGSLQPPVNIIFVHGLMGHPQNTWECWKSTEQDQSGESGRKGGLRGFFVGKRNQQGPGPAADVQKVFWPKQLLGPALPNARLWTYGYNADVTGGRIFQANNQNSVSQHGRDLSVKLEGDIDNEDPIVFVAHSLGGIIVKDALDRSRSSRQRTRLVIFLGTPHRGSQYSDWAQIAQNLAKLVGQDSNKKVTGALKVNSEILENIHQKFIDLVVESDIYIHSFQEAKGISGMRGFQNQVVDYVSSKCDLPTSREKVETIDADHRQMTKFCDTNDPGFRAILRVLKQSSCELPRTCSVVPTALPEPNVSDAPTNLPNLRNTANDNALPHHLVLAREEACLQSLYTNYESTRRNIPTRHPGTCEWLLLHSDFRIWADTTISMPLWISGNPGMGKTVLSKYLIEHFAKQSSKYHPIRVVFGFFSDQDSERKTAISLLKGIIHQCVTSNRQLLHKHIMPLYTSKGTAIFTSLHTLWTIFIGIAAEMSAIYGEMICIIDALDECEEESRNELLREIGDHLEKEASNTGQQSYRKRIRFIMTSRPYEKIRTKFHRYTIIRLQAEREEKRINKDIATYVDYEMDQLAQLRGYSDELKSTVRDALLKGADGMFLWISLMVKLLEMTPVRSVKVKVKQLPKGIDGIYSRLLEEISEDSEAIVSNILKWVVYAMRPLSLLELGIACTIHSEQTSQSSILVSEREAIRDDIKFCGPILKISDDDTVQLVHQTTRGFLLQSFDSNPILPRILVAEVDAHFEIGLACMTYLCFGDFAQDHPDIFGDHSADRKAYDQFVMEYPFLEYASVFWHHHVQRAPEKSSELLAAVNRTLSSKIKRAFWLNIRQRLIEDRLLYEQSALQILVRFNLELAFSKEIVSGSHELNHKDDCSSTALHIAAEFGRALMIKLILDNPGARVSINESQRVKHMIGRPSRSDSAYKIIESMPLHLACRNGHEEIVKMLLRHGANVEEEEKEFEHRQVSSYEQYSVSKRRRSIHLALRYRHWKVVSTLLEHGVDVNAHEEEFEDFNPYWVAGKARKLRLSPLDLATPAMPTEIRNLLIEQGGRESPYNTANHRGEYKRSSVVHRYSDEVMGSSSSEDSSEEED